MLTPIKAPFPWFGGKSRAASLIWERLGDVKNYIEPFAGSLAVLLGRPTEPKIETVNDKDAFICNFWRSVKMDAEAVAKHADNPVNEADLTARHVWLVNHRQELVDRLFGDPDYYDAKIAGWWCWGICCWIGSGWCSGKGPWQSIDGKLVHLANADMGVNRKRVYLNAGMGVNSNAATNLYKWFSDLGNRLRHVRVCCGDWKRVCSSNTVLTNLGLTGLVLDPPYSNDVRTSGLYTEDDGSVAIECRNWALNHSNNPMLRIALCGYGTEHELPGWEKVAWSGRTNANMYRETIWFSPSCLNKENKPTAWTGFEKEEEMATLDRFFTPSELVAAAMQKLKQAYPYFNPVTVLEPGCGAAIHLDYALVEFPSIVLSTALDTDVSAIPPLELHNVVEHDFLTWSTPQKYELIVTNPPYSLAEQFIRKSVELLSPNGLCMFLCKLSMVGSLGRSTGLWRETYLRHAWIIAPRPSFTGGGTDSSEYAYLVFSKGSVGTCTLDWLVWQYILHASYLYSTHSLPQQSFSIR